MTDWKLHRTELEAFLDGAETIAVGTHARPDPDAIGSLLGVAHILRAQGKTVYPYVDGGIESRWHWLPGSTAAINVTPVPNLDRVLILDCDSPARLGETKHLLTRGPVAMVDHHEVHVGSDGLSGLHVIDVAASSTAEMLYQIFSTSPAAPISQEAATCLYFGLWGDTLGFRSLKTRPETFFTAAGLVAHGANAQAIADSFADRSFKELKLEGMAQANARSLCDGAVLYTEVTEEMLRQVGATQAERLGNHIVNILATVTGPKLFLAVFERASNNYKLSVRSYRPFNSAQFCQQFGGNGHEAAAGVTEILQPLEGVRKMLFDAVEREVKTRLGRGL